MSDALVLSGVILMALGIMIPCLIWFIRNLYRIVLKKDVWWLNHSLKLFWLAGLLVAILGIILIIVRLVQGN